MLKRQFRYSFSKGVPHQKLITPLFILRYERSDTPTLGVVSGKVVSKKAVERNRAKRIFLATLQEVFLKKENKHTLVFFLRRPFVEYQKSAIIGELQNTLGKIN